MTFPDEPRAIDLGQNGQLILTPGLSGTLIAGIELRQENPAGVPQGHIYLTVPQAIQLRNEINDILRNEK